VKATTTTQISPAELASIFSYLFGTQATNSSSIVTLGPQASIPSSNTFPVTGLPTQSDATATKQSNLTTIPSINPTTAISIPDPTINATSTRKATSSRTKTTRRPHFTPQPRPSTQHPAATEPWQTAYTASTPIPTCKTVIGDARWPQDEVWKAALPGVINLGVRGTNPHPNYYFAASDRTEVQAAVNFARKYDVRFSVISSGLDYMGR
jgi:hypothetical protein